MKDSYKLIPLKGMRKIAMYVYRYGNKETKAIVLTIENNIVKRQGHTNIHSNKEEMVAVTLKEYNYLKKEYENVL